MATKQKVSVVKAINLNNEKVKHFTKMFESEHRLSRALSASSANPVISKNHISKEIPYSREKPIICNKPIEVLEIEKLDDYVAPTHQETGLVERLQEQRQEKHEKCVNELKNSLLTLGLEFQNEIQKPIDEFQHNQELNNKTISELMNSLKGNYADINESQIRNLWKKIDNNFDNNVVYINKLHEFLLHIQDQHLKQAFSTLQSFHKKMMLIGHLSADELDNLISSEALIIEVVILTNKRLLSDLHLQLTQQNIFDEQKNYLKWQLYWEKWRNNLTSSALHEFKNLIQAISEGENGFIRSQLMKFKIDEQLVILKRMEAIYTVRSIKLPKCGIENIMMWKKSLKKFADRHENLLGQLNDKMTIWNKEVIELYTTEMTKIKQSLLKRNICSEKLMTSLIDDHHKTMTDEYLIELNIHLHNEKKDALYRKDGMDALEQHVISFLQETYDLWEQHQILLHDLEKLLQKTLDKEDRKLAILCKEQEDRLTLIVDQMREANSNDELQTKYSLVLDILSEIYNCYIHCHQAKVNIISGYPKMISNEVMAYKEKLKQHLGSFVGHLLDTGIDEDTGKRIKSSPSLPTRRSFEFSSTQTQERPMTADDRRQLEHIEVHGLKLRKLKDKRISDPDLSGLPGTALDLSWAPSDFSVTKVQWHDISESQLSRLCRIIAVNFAVHFGQWNLESAKNGQNIKEAKILEMNNELELQHRLHEPRATRIKSDILEVRASELVLQLNRVKSHIQGVYDEFEALQKGFNLLKDHEKSLFDTLSEKMADFEERCRITIPSNMVPKCRQETLQTISRQIQKFYDLKDEFSSDLHNILSHLKLSNEIFMKSFRKIQQGGTFNEIKAKDYEAQLRKLPQVIQEWEHLYQNELQTMENDCVTKENHMKKTIEDCCESAALVSGFLEKLAEGFRNVQLNIKIEVKTYNKEGAVIIETQEKLRSKFEMIKATTPGESLVILEQLLGEIQQLMTLLLDRGVHLGIFKILPYGEITTVKSDWRLKTVPDFHGLMSTAADNVSLQGLKSKGKDGSNTPSLYKIPIECYIFGEKPALENHFVSVIKSHLFKIHTDLLSHAENFFKHKNQIMIWPSVLSEYLSDCCILITMKFKNYWDQVEDFFSKCIAEFAQQLLQLEKLIFDCHASLFQILSDYKETIVNNLLEQLKAKNADIYTKWSDLKVTFTNNLRPHLGHPSQHAQLQKIIDKVRKEYNNHLIEITDVLQIFKNEVIEHGQVFVRELNRLTQPLFDLLDNTLIKGNFPASILSLVDGRYAPSPDLQTTPKVNVPGPASNTTSQWPHLLDYDWKVIQSEGTSTSSSKSDLVSVEKTFSTSKAKTALHLASVKLRDEIYRAFQEKYIKCIKDMEAEQEKYLCSQNTWLADWINSTENLKGAYLKKH